MPCLPLHWLWWASNESQIRAAVGGGLRWRISWSPALKGILGDGSGEGTCVPHTSDSCHEDMLTC